MTDTWRVGRRVPVHLYKGDEPAGTALTPELAAELVAATEAVARVLALHERQDRPAFGPLVTRDGEVIAEGGPARSICGRCSHQWPCPTVRAVRGGP